MIVFLLLLLVAVPALAKESAVVTPSHLKALKAVGLPMYTLPEGAVPWYRGSSLSIDGKRKSYEIEYWYRGSDIAQEIHVSFASEPLPPDPRDKDARVVETQKLQAGQIGAVTVERFERGSGRHLFPGCRTGWIRRPGGYLRVQTGEMNIAQCAQLLESLRIAAAQPPGKRLDVVKATGIPVWELPGRPPEKTAVRFDSSRSWHGYELEYPSLGLGIQGTRGGIGDVGVGYEHPALDERTLGVGGVKFWAFRSRQAHGPKPGPVRCYTEWSKTGNGYVNVHSTNDMQFARFLDLLAQLRRVT